jgi:hypothetical protein
MKRFLLPIAAVAALAIPAILPAANTANGTLSVKRGRAVIVLKLRGTVIGSLGNGSVRIRDLTPLSGPAPQFHNCRTLRHINASTTVCKGRKLTFRALDGPYSVTLKGVGIFLSAVGRGTVTFDGTGEPTFPNGVMSFDNGPYMPIPDEPTSYALGTAAGS